MKNRKDPEPHGEWGSFFSGAAAGALEVAAAEADAATAAEANAAEKTGAGTLSGVNAGTVAGTDDAAQTGSGTPGGASTGTVMEADKDMVTNAMPGRKGLHFPARGLIFVLLLSVPGFWNSGLFAKNPMMEIYEARRKALMEKLEDGIAVLQNTGNDKNFYYLTGMDERDAVCMLMPGAEKEFILFVRNVNPLFVLYSGYFAGVEGAMHTFGADTAFSHDQMERTIIEALRGRTRVFFPFSERGLRDKIMNLLSFPRENYPAHAVNLSPLIHEMRVRKDPSEIALLRQAIDITCEAQTGAMKFARPGCWEYEIEAVIEYHFRKNGSEQPGFPSIVGSGPNSTVLHHEKNDRKTENGDLVVMDIGAEYRGYTADVTRTIPVNGRFSPKQKALYEILLKAHKEAVDMIRPGLGIQEIHNHACRVMAQELYKLGLMTDPDSRWQFRLYLTYDISHWLGLDVHDVGEYRRGDDIGRKLEPGMVLTVEPGIYISDNTLKLIPGRGNIPQEEIDDFMKKAGPVIAEYRNTGMRIEDDVLVTEDGHENLSKAAPKEIREIEKIMKK